MNCIIIDDDYDFASHLRTQLEQTLGLVVLDEAHSVSKGIEVLNRHQPDLIFLDMELPDGCGLDILEVFRKVTFKVIVVSAHDQFAISAIKFSAMDYLLKPFSLKDLSIAVEKIRDLRAEKSHEIRNSYLENQQSAKSKIRKLGINTLNDIHFVEVHEISFCKADGNYTEVHFHDFKSPILSSKPIKHFEELLEPYNFFRTHKSFLVNINYIKGFNKADSMLQLQHEQSIPVSRQRREYLMDKMNFI
jgi:two-component system LytT family response regulator